MTNPFEDQPELVEFYDLIGRIVIAWSRIERVIDITLWAARDYDSDTKDKAIVSWKRKFRAFRRICRKHPKTSHLSEWLEKHFNEISAIADNRHLIIHGYCQGIVHEEVTKIWFQSLRYDPEGRIQSEFKASVEELIAYLRRFREIEHHLSMIMFAITTAKK